MEKQKPDGESGLFRPVRCYPPSWGALQSAYNSGLNISVNSNTISVDNLHLYRGALVLVNRKTLEAVFDGEVYAGSDVLYYDEFELKAILANPNFLSVSMTSIGVDNSWRTPWWFLDGFLHPELMNVSTPNMSATVAGNYLGTAMAATEGSLWIESKIAQGTFYTSEATERALARNGKNLVGKGGRNLGYASAIYGGIESFYSKGKLSEGDITKAAIGFGTAYFGTFGGFYGALDLGVAIWTGTSITDRVGAGVDYSYGMSKKYAK